MQENIISDIAVRLVPRIKESDGFTIEPVVGGGNNKLFLLSVGGNKYILKYYFSHSNDKRDRLNVEYSFSTFAWDCGIRCISEPIACDGQDHAALYSFIEGRKPAVSDVTRNAVEQALGFISELNRNRISKGARLLVDASEACFSLEEHVRTIDKRLEMLKKMEVRDEIDAEARLFIEHELAQNWLEVKNHIVAEAGAIGIHYQRLLSNAERVLSPSDFGFHNAVIADNGTINFLDFEYAGWDDPAKMICDFFCQPAFPIPMDYWDFFSDGVADCVEDLEAVRARAHILFPLYKIKWCCIILNHFLPLGRERKKFAGLGPDKQKKNQLNRAMSLLSSINTIKTKEVTS